MASALTRTRGLIFPFLGAILAFTLGKISGDGQSSLLLFGFILAGVFMLAFFSVAISLQLLIASMLLSPEIMIGKTSLRDVTIRFDDIVLSAMIISWLLRMAILKDIGFIRKNPISAPLYVYSALAAVCTTIGVFNGHVNPLTGFFFVVKIIEYFLLYIMVVNYVRDFETVKRLLTTTLIVWGLICLYGFFQAVTGGDVAAPFEGSTGERNTLSGYLVLVGSVAVGVMMHTQSYYEKRLLAVGVLLMIVVLLFSISRSGWVAGTVAGAILFWHSPRRDIFFMTTLTVAMLVVLFTPEVVKDRIFFTFNQVANPLAQVKIGKIALDTSTSSRIFSVWEVFRDFFRHPFVGFGVTGYRMFLDGQFFRTLAEMGVPGLACLIWIFKRISHFSRRAIRADLPVRIHGLCIGFYAGFCGLLAHAISANTFIIVRITEPFWCLAGLVTVAVEIGIREIERPAGETGSSKEVFPMA